MAYNPSNEGGQAIADILFGDVNPSGKLPITYPRSVNRLFTYDHKVFEGEDWGEGKAMAAPQFEFGSGLSYTTFSYSDLHVAPASASGSQTVRVDVTVKNSGGRAGKGHHAYFSVFSSVISAFSTLETGQPFSAASASLSNVA